MANILSCNLASYRGHLQAAYEHLPTIGVKYVEFGLPGAEDIPPLVATLGAHRLSAMSVIASADISSPIYVDEWVDICERATSLGARVVFTSVHAGENPRDAVFARLRAAGDVAARYGLKIAMETHPDLMTNGTIAAETLRAIDHPNVGMNFDCANIMYYNEGTTTVAELEKVAPRVFSVHLKDSAGLYRTWNFPTLGRGIVDFPRVFEILNGVGFYGPFTLELEGIEGQRLNAEEACADVAASVAYLRSIAEFE